jgi:hypothetical protein
MTPVPFLARLAERVPPPRINDIMDKIAADNAMQPGIWRTGFILERADQDPGRAADRLNGCGAKVRDPRRASGILHVSFDRSLLEKVAEIAVSEGTELLHPSLF